MARTAPKAMTGKDVRPPESIGRLSIRGLGSSTHDSNSNSTKPRKSATAGKKARAPSLRDSDDSRGRDNGNDRAASESTNKRNGRPQLVKLAPSKRDLLSSSQHKQSQSQSQLASSSRHSVDYAQSLGSSDTWTSFNSSFGEESFGSFASTDDHHDDEQQLVAKPGGERNQTDEQRIDGRHQQQQEERAKSQPEHHRERQKQKQERKPRQGRSKSKRHRGKDVDSDDHHHHEATDGAHPRDEDEGRHSSVDSMNSEGRKKHASRSYSNKRRSRSSRRSQASARSEDNDVVGQKLRPRLLVSEQSNSNLSKVTATTAASSLSGADPRYFSTDPTRRTISREQSESWLKLVPERPEESPLSRGSQHTAASSRKSPSARRNPRSKSRDDSLQVQSSHQSTRRRRRRDSLSMSLHSTTKDSNGTSALAKKPTSKELSPLRRSKSSLDSASGHSKTTSRGSNLRVSSHNIRRRSRPHGSKTKSRTGSSGNAKEGTNAKHVERSKGTGEGERLDDNRASLYSESGNRQHQQQQQSQRRSRRASMTTSHSRNPSYIKAHTGDNATSGDDALDRPIQPFKRSNSETSLLDLKKGRNKPRGESLLTTEHPKHSTSRRSQSRRRASMDSAAPSRHRNGRESSTQQSSSLINMRRQMYARHRSNSEGSLREPTTRTLRDHFEIPPEPADRKKELLSLLVALNDRLTTALPEPTQQINNRNSKGSNCKGNESNSSSSKQNNQQTTTTKKNNKNIAAKPRKDAKGKSCNRAQQPNSNSMAEESQKVTTKVDSSLALDEIQEHVEASLLRLEARALTPNRKQKISTCRESSVRNLTRYRKSLEQRLLNSHLFRAVECNKGMELEQFQISSHSRHDVSTASSMDSSKLSLDRFIIMMQQSQDDYTKSQSGADRRSASIAASSQTEDLDSQQHEDIPQGVVTSKQSSEFCDRDDGTPDDPNDVMDESETSFHSSVCSYEMEASESEHESSSLHIRDGHFLPSSPSRTTRSSSFSTVHTRELLESLPEGQHELESKTLTLSLDVMQRPIEPQDLDDDRIMVNKAEWTDDDSGMAVRYTGMLAESSRMPCGHGKLEYLVHPSQQQRDPAIMKEPALNHHFLIHWYKGQFVHGIKNGFGECSYWDGEIYKGFFADNLKHGQGTLDYPDGRRFEGTFDAGSKIEGTMSYEDGSTYKGSFHHGVRHGSNGTYKFGNTALVYVGDFYRDQIQGQGVLTWPNGGKYAGSWKRGVRHGYGKEFRADGTVMQAGWWENGRLVEAEEEAVEDEDEDEED